MMDVSRSVGSCSENSTDTLASKMMNTHLDDSPMQSMLLRLIKQSGPHFRHEIMGEPPLCESDKMRIALELYLNNPGQFLARYHTYLLWPDDVVCFEDYLDDYIVKFYLKQAGIDIQISNDLTDSFSITYCSTAKQKQYISSRNRRFAAMKRMKAESECDPTEGYFSYEQMRQRDPHLWETMIGQYLSSADRRSLLGRQYDSFSGMLLSQLMENEDSSAHLHYDISEESESSSKFKNSEEIDSKEKDEAETERLRSEYLEIMQSRFISGIDTDFDYTSIDNDETLDVDPEAYRDEEDRYFDSESPHQIYDNFEDTKEL